MENLQLYGENIDPWLGKGGLHLGKRQNTGNQDMRRENKRQSCTRFRAVIFLENTSSEDFGNISKKCLSRCRNYRPVSISKRKNYTRTLQRFPNIPSLSIYSFLLISFTLIPSLTGSAYFGPRAVSACHPSTNPSIPRPIPPKLTPFVYRQHIPNVSEKTIGASGPSEGKITRESNRFSEELISNWNPQIVFKDEEHTNADRMMTERCRDRLNRLAIMVSNYWKDTVKLRVTEGWDEDSAHGLDSLHYEGRAVDITTTDRDRSKYGMLARLAVEAEFDWVSYDHKSHIHCSVKSEKSDAARYGGCFPGDSTVYRKNGESVKLSELRVGDSILAMDSYGNVVEDEVLGFMDMQLPKNGRQHTFIEIETENSKKIRLTKNHLIYVSKGRPSPPSATGHQSLMLNSKKIHADSEKIVKDQNTHKSNSFRNSCATFAESVKSGDFVFSLQKDTEIAEHANTSNKIISRRVKSVSVISAKSGAYAPLTKHGNIIVDNVAASCYAVIDSHEVAHWVMAPLRYYRVMAAWWRKITTEITKPFSADDIAQNGVHWYPHFLYQIGAALLPDSLMKTF